MNTGPVYTRNSYSPIGAVGYDDWESDPAHALIIHTATGCTFALEPSFPPTAVRFFGMRDGDPPPDADALRYLGTLAARWFTVFGFSRPIAPRGFG